MLIKFSEFWLRQFFVNLDINKKKLLEQLNLLGIEVENCKKISFFYKNIFVGNIIDIKTVSLNKKKFLITVDIGKKNKLLNIIVNNKKHFLKNLKIIVATKIATKNTKSDGLICTFKDLLINKSSDIIILNNDVKIGSFPTQYINLQDNLYTVNITPNRSDCLSIMGIARDLAALNTLSLKKIKTKKIKLNKNIFLKSNFDYIPKHSLIYNIRIINNIDNTAFLPLSIKEKLLRSNIRLKDTITNIMNYVLLKFGHPVNIMDYDEIDSFIHLRFSKKNEFFNLSKNKKIQLASNTIILSDKSKVISISGIENDNNVKINQKTKNILLECSYFESSFIIYQSQKNSLFTDYSYRYERGVDYLLHKKIMNYITYLIIKICGGNPGPITLYNNNFKKYNKKILLTQNKLDRIIGHKINPININNILKSLGFKVTNKKKSWLVKVPSWRFDISIEEDLIEEILRIYGYNNIPNVTLKYKVKIDKNNQYFNLLSLNKSKYILANRGYQEVINYSFVNKNYQSIFYPNKKFIFLSNPFSKDMEIMRCSMFSGLISNLIYNQNRQQNKIKFFEVGKCFIEDKKNKYKIYEKIIFSGLLSGYAYEDHWNKSNKLVDFYDIKGDIESLLDQNNILEMIEFKKNENIYFLHPGQSASIFLNDIKIGIVGSIHPDIQKKFQIKYPTFLFEILWEKINKIRCISKIQKISKFPMNYRDISFFIDQKIESHHVIKECKKFFLENKINLLNISVCDVYQDLNNKNIKSLSIKFIIQNIEYTFSDQEINNFIDKLIKDLKYKFNIILRNN